MMVRVLGSTSVLQRLSLFLLEEFGTRLRNVALVCLSAAVVVPLLVHDTLAVLLVLALVRRLVFDIMNENLQSMMAFQAQELPWNEVHALRRGRSDGSTGGANANPAPSNSRPAQRLPADVESPASPVPPRGLTSREERDAAARSGATTNVSQPAENPTYPSCRLPAPAEQQPPGDDSALTVGTSSISNAGPSRISDHGPDGAWLGLASQPHHCFGRKASESEASIEGASARGSAASEVVAKLHQER
ncbi:uncharacterized protein LOC144100356 [Amblyomma americanum]